MTDADIKTLRALEQTMVKAVDVVHATIQTYKATQEAAKPYTPAWEEARRMKSWCEGRLLAHVTDLNGLREAFPDELITEEPQKHPLGCTCPECADERGDRIFHARKEEI